MSDLQKYRGKFIWGAATVLLALSMSTIGAALVVRSNTSVLSTLLGDVSEHQLDQFRESFRDLEQRVSDQRRWPQTPEDAAHLRKSYVDLLDALPPLMQQANVNRLEALDWCIAVLEATAGPMTQSPTEYSYQNLFEELPSGVQPDLKVRLRQRVDEWLRLQTTRPTALDTALSKPADPDIAGEQILLLCGDLRSRMDRTNAIQEERVRSAVVSQVYEAAFAAQVDLQVRGLSIPDELKAILADAESNLKAFAELQEKQDATRVKAYQKWALGQIKSFLVEFNGRTDEAAEILEALKQKPPPSI